RIFTDRFIPMNLSIPRLADVVVGAGFGLASGVLSVGLLAIGMGFFQSTVTIGDFTGWSRRSDVANAPAIGSDNAPLLTISGIAGGFFSYLSWGPYTPWLGGGTIDTHMPQLVRTSGSLYRDSYADGLARVSVPPEAVSALKLFDVPAMPLSAGVGAKPVASWAVQFTIAQDGFDGAGQQFLMTGAQARLIGDGKGGKGTVSYPVAWRQNAKEGGERMYFFNSPSNVLTSVSAQGEGTFYLFFPKADLGTQAPKYFELKGVRFLAPRPIAAPDFAGGGAIDSGSSKAVDDGAATNIDSLIEFPDPKYAIGGVTINSNDKGALLLDGSNYIVGGEQKFPRNGSAMVSADLRVRGFQVTAGQRLLRLDASAKADGVRIFPDLNEWVRTAGTDAQSARVAVIDTNGAKYFAVGMVEDDGDWVLVRSMGGKPLTLKDIPIQPLGSGKKLMLHFRLPSSTVLKGLVLVTGKEDRLVNTITLTAPKDKD
ncbi:MAG: hypothetical protein EBR07_07340, partial [Planctomycetes bacterium]|nr:hypothetical protein [Planctomycetota bacterium]